jgi:hydrogenase/urease accessory protein HupE
VKLRGVFAGALVACAVLPGPAAAHEVRPGYLEIRELDEKTYDILWKVPAKGDKRLGLYVGLPAECRDFEVVGTMVPGGFVERRRVECDGGLIGKSVRIDGLADTRTDVLARVERGEAGMQTVRLTPDEPAFVVARAPSALDVARTYFDLGVEHILFGVDHLLFVLALLFLVGDWRRLVGTVTAFTVAHSVTLAASTLGWVRAPQAPVEAVIALSIVFVAVEVFHARQGRKGIAARQPWVVAFVFGLLHGFGFAGALRDVGLPEQHVPLALGLFNVGVEAGQLLFVAGVFVLVYGLRRVLPAFAERDAGEWAAMDRVSGPAAYVIGTLAAFWLIERTWGFVVA